MTFILYLIGFVFFSFYHAHLDQKAGVEPSAWYSLTFGVIWPVGIPIVFAVGLLRAFR